MLYPFLTLNDETVIVHSEMLENNEVRVRCETPDEKNGFHSLTLYLPSYRISEKYGYSENEIEFLLNIIEKSAHLIMEFSKQGGFENASVV